MGDKVFTNQDKAEKPDQASAAYLEAQKRLAETRTLSTASSFDSGINGQSTKSPSVQAAAQESTANNASKPGEVVPNNNPLHLTDLAITSVAKGLLEPLAGGVQITEQFANAATLHLPGVHKAYFSPEKLAPAQPTQNYVKYSGEWFTSNIGESVGKLPWYYAAGKVMSKVPGFKVEAGALSESGLLGMSVKTSAASGFIVGALNPTVVPEKDGLMASVTERGIQGVIGAGQMALMTGTTSLVGKGFAAGEKALVGTEAAAAEQTLAQTAQRTFLKTSTQATLKFVKNGTIASVGSMPAGYLAGYANAKIHHTEFDPAANIIATATIGFGLGGFSSAKAEAPQARTAGSKIEAPVEAPVKSVKSPVEVSRGPSTPTENNGSPITARARARITELADKARAAFAGGQPDGYAFNSNDGVPDTSTPGGTAKDATAKDGTAKPGTAKDGAAEPENKPADEAAGPKEKTFDVTLNTPEQLAKYQGVFDSLMKASKQGGTQADEADFVKAASAEPWAIRLVRENLAEQNVKSDHVNGLLDRADQAVRDNAIATEKVPPIGQPSFGQGFDLLRNIAEAQKPEQRTEGLQALRSFVTDSDAVLASKDQLRSAAEKLGGPELAKEFDSALNKRYPIAQVHQLAEPLKLRSRGQIVEVRSTQVEQFNSIVWQARVAAEALAKGANGELESSREQRYIGLRVLTENLDPDLKASLINYASKTNDFRFRALINDVLTDPKGENLPNKPIQLSYKAELEPAWDRIENRLAAHPKPDVPGEAPSAAAVAEYRKTVFEALSHYEGKNPDVIKLAMQYALQTNNSFEASALDYYFSGNRLNAFEGVRQAKTEASDVTENRNNFVQKAAAPEAVNLETGEMNDAYLARVIDRLGSKDTGTVIKWANEPPVENLLNEAQRKFTDHGVTRAKYSDRPDGLVKVTSQPDNTAGPFGGKHTTAEYINNPNGRVQVDDYADGTRWIREKPDGQPESTSVYYGNGTEATYFSPEVWSVDFPNGNYIYSYPENESNVAREIKENGKISQVLRDGTTRVISDASSTEEQPEHIQAGSQITVETLLEQMKSAQNETGRIAAADALKGQIGSMDDSQFKAWLDFIRITPNEANARPAYMKMSGLRGMHGLFESGILDDPATQKAFKSYLEVPAPGEFKLAFPKSMQGITSDQMPQALSNDVRARFSTKAADGTTIYEPNLPIELQRHFETTKPHSIKDKWDNEAPALATDNLAARLNAIPDLASFQPKTASRLLELGAQDPRALADVMKLIKEPRNDIPAMRSLLAETIPNADDIYTVKLMLDSIDAARRAYKTPSVKEANRDLAMTALADLTGDVAQDIKLGAKIDEIIKAPGGGKGAPDTSRLAGNLELLPRTKADPNAVNPAQQPDPAETHDSSKPDGQATIVPAESGAPPVEVPAPASSEATGDANLENGTAGAVPPSDSPQVGSGDTTLAKDATEEAPAAPVEPIKPTVENLVDKMNSNEPDRARLSAAEALTGQLSSMDDAQFHDWLQFVRQNSLEAPIRPNYMKMSGMRGLAEVLDSNLLDDPAAAKALRDYLTPPVPGEFKLAYPNVLKAMSIDDMSPGLLNDIRDRFSIKGPDGLIFQADVPPEMQDYLNNNQRLKVTDNKGRRLPDLQPDTLDTRVAVSSQLAGFQPETAGRLLELGAQDPRALADVIRLMKEPRNDNPTMRNLLSETIPNADDIYTLKLFLDSIDAARWAFSPDRAQERATNTNVALNALSELTGDTAQDVRLGKDVQSIIRMKGFIPNPRPSKLADNLELGERTKIDPVLAIAPAPEPAEPLQPIAPPIEQAGAANLTSPAGVSPEEAAALLSAATTGGSQAVELAPPAPPLVVEPPAPTVIEPAQIATPTQIAGAPGDQTIAAKIEQEPKAPQIIPPPEAIQTASTDRPPTTTGGGGRSQLDKFNDRQRRVQQNQRPQNPAAPKQSGTAGSSSSKPARVFRNLADLKEIDLSGALDDTGVGDKGRNTDSFSRNQESRRRDQEKQNRRDGGDDDN
jgi:hypothetical protein